MKTTMKLLAKRRGNLLMAVGLLLVIAAALLTAYNFWDESRAEGAAQQVLSEIEAVTLDGNASDAEIALDEVPEYVVHPEMDMPSLTLDRSKYIGILEIPVIGLRLPIMAEWSTSNSKIAPCRYSGTAYLNDMVIAGHNYRSHFGSLNKLQVGDEILFIDIDDNRFLYNVVETEVLAPTEIDRMVSGPWDLTLFTCTYGGRTRFTVRCRAVYDSGTNIYQQIEPTA
ncbi:MAG: sortase [Oscillospiraceae bacterium]|nr:sortase [Oscillospiraceae bacterium]